MRVDPGTQVPLHPHHAAEECYMLDGDLDTYGTVLRRGDYLRAPAGTVHAPSRSEGGCLILVTAGLDEHASG
jgi:anti-sigma factor ChrR (cupin superfamily)